MSSAYVGHAGEKSFYDENRRGWWWYEVEPVKNKDRKENQERDKQ
jgi:hypothetical protein